MTTFFRLLEARIDEKPPTLRAAIAWVGQLHDMGKCNTKLQSMVFDARPATFKEIPTSPFAYWVSQTIRDIFGRGTAFETERRIARRTNSVDNDFRYVRAWWEASGFSLAEVRWAVWAKGGAFSRYYYDPDTVIAWDASRQSYPGFLGTDNRPLERPACVQHFFRPGLTWPRRTNGLSFRVLPGGCIFADKGPAAFVEGDAPAQLLSLSALMNSSPFAYLVSVQLARTELAQSYEVGLIQQTPIPNLPATDAEALAKLARRAWSLKRTLDTTNEASHAFVLPPGIGFGAFDRSAIEQELRHIQREIDARAFDLYGITEEDRVTIQSASNRSSASQGNNESGTNDDADDTDESDEAAPDVAVLPVYSWLVGVAFGRFDKRLATGEREIPPEPEPFDPLPSRSPGMWPESDSSWRLGALAVPPSILLDDAGHSLDLPALMSLAAAGTGIDLPHELRQWLAREFFPLHIKMYSKSRRKAPIYWQLATQSASYSVWLYIHAFTKDTLYKAQNEYVAPKLAHEERKLESMRRELGASPKPAERKALAAQETFVDDLRAFLDEVKRVAPLWNPDLDDGVIINFAPLWRLVPHHKPWQKELKSTWDGLCEGRYDWAHLAMHLWPERVVPKCAKDRSLAIAHGLEDVFWVEGTNGKWTARKTATKSVDELVHERISPAVKSALKSLLEAPISPAATRRASRIKKEP